MAKRGLIIALTILSFFCMENVQASNVSYKYDSLSRLVEVLYENSGKIVYTFDAAGNRLSQTVTAFTPAVSVSPAIRNVNKEAGTTPFRVSNTGTGTLTWTASVTSGGTWLSIQSGAGGTDSGTITCAFTANTGGVARTGTVRVAAPGATGSPRDVTVTQGINASPILSGSVKTGSGAAVSGVTITFSNDGGTATTDSSGNYSKALIHYSWSGTATPSKAGYTFSPASRTYANVTSSQAGQNYTATTSSSYFMGIWSDGVWVWNQSTKQWTKIASTASVLMIAAGKVDTDSVEDLIGVWSSGLWVRYSSTGQWVKLSSNLPTWITAGDMNNDGRDDVIGSWKNDGVYYRNSATGQWVKITTPARQLAAGNVHGDGRDDLVGVWDSGLWARYSATSAWQKIDPTIPVWIAAGDMTGNNRTDIIGSYSSGTWLWNSATGAWTKITTPAEQLSAGDINGDGREDLLGVWSSGVWVRYGATGQWQQITASKPKWIIAGRVADAVQAAGSLDDPIETDVNLLDLSGLEPGVDEVDMIDNGVDGPDKAD